MAEPAREALAIRGLPEWLIRDYLAAMGAAADGAAADGAVADGAAGSRAAMRAERWSVRWSSRRMPIAGGGLTLTQFDLIFEGEPEAVRQARDLFLKKAQRGGG